MKFRTWVQTHFSRHRKKKSKEENVKPLKLATRGHGSSPKTKSSKLSKISCLKPSNSDHQGFIVPNAYTSNSLSSPESAYSTAHSDDGLSPHGHVQCTKLPPGYSSPFLSRNQDYYSSVSDKSTYSPSMYRLVFPCQNSLDDIDEAPSLQDSTPSLELPLHHARNSITSNDLINGSKAFPIRTYQSETITSSADEMKHGRNSLSQLNDISDDRISVSSPRQRCRIKTNPWMSPAPTKCPMPKIPPQSNQQYSTVSLHSNLQHSNAGSPFRMIQHHSSTECDITMRSHSETRLANQSAISLSSFPPTNRNSSHSETSVTNQSTSSLSTFPSTTRNSTFSETSVTNQSTISLSSFPASNRNSSYSETSVTNQSTISLSSFPCASNRNSTSDSDGFVNDFPPSCRTSSGFGSISLSNASSFSYCPKPYTQASTRIYDSPLITSSSDECLINDSIKNDLKYKETDILSDSENSEWTRGVYPSDFSDMFLDDSETDLDVIDSEILVSNYNYDNFKVNGINAQMYSKEKSSEKLAKPNTLELKLNSNSLMEKLKEEEELFQEQAMYDKQADEHCRQLISATEDILRSLEEEMQQSPVIVTPCFNKEEEVSYRSNMKDVLRLNIKDVLSPIIECPSALSQPSTPGTPLTPCVATPSSDWICGRSFGSFDSLSDILGDSTCTTPGTPMSDISDTRIPTNVVPSIQKIFKNLRLIPHMKDVATSPLSPCVPFPSDKFSECVIPILSNIPEEDSTFSEESQSSDDQLDTFTMKMNSLKIDKKNVEKVETEGQEGDKWKQMETVRYQDEVCTYKRQLLLSTLHNLKENLEEQSSRLQDAYKSTINMQIQIRKQRSQLQNSQ